VASGTLRARLRADARRRLSVASDLAADLAAVWGQRVAWRAVNRVRKTLPGKEAAADGAATWEAHRAKAAAGDSDAPGTRPGSDDAARNGAPRG
jgi:hypothetical protein